MPPKVRVNLVVLRGPDPESLAHFYTVVGLDFEIHQHGKGPKHYTAVAENGVTFEIYPLDHRTASTTAVRIGFQVADVDKTMAAMKAAGGTIVTQPAPSPWGRRAVITDPVGHTVEITSP
jgi:lactoylglutathione lyase